MILLLIGPPACGKGTIGKMLSEKLNLPLLTPGQLLRDIPVSSIWYEPIHASMDKGLLVPKSIVSGILNEETKDPKYQNGFILDGWFRDLDSRDYFYPKIDKVLYLNISKELALKRSTSRRVCLQEGHTYNLELLKPKIEGVCDIDGSPLIARIDDSEEAFNTRYSDFEKMTLEVIKYFRQSGILLEIDASKTPEKITEDILGKLYT